MEASAIHAPAALGRFPRGGGLLRLRSDEQLIAAFRSGNDEAFRILHDRYRQRLFAYVRQMLSSCSRQDAEDVLQDVFVRAYGAAAQRQPRDERARVAVPRRPQPLHRPSAPPGPARGRDLRGLAQAAARPGRGGPAPRRPAPARRRRRPAPGAAALGAADARDRRHDLRRPGERAGRHGPRRQVAARPRPRRARRGRRGPRRRLRRDPGRPAARLRPRRQGLRPRPQAHALVRRLHRVPRRAARDAPLVRRAVADRRRPAGVRGQADRPRRLAVPRRAGRRLARPWPVAAPRRPRRRARSPRSSAPRRSRPAARSRSTTRSRQRRRPAARPKTEDGQGPHGAHAPPAAAPVVGTSRRQAAGRDLAPPRAPPARRPPRPSASARPTTDAQAEGASVAPLRSRCRTTPAPAAPPTRRSRPAASAPPTRPPRRRRSRPLRPRPIAPIADQPQPAPAPATAGSEQPAAPPGRRRRRSPGADVDAPPPPAGG